MKIPEKTIIDTCVDYLMGRGKPVYFPTEKTYHLIFDKTPWTVGQLKEKLSEIPDDAKLASMDYIDDSSTMRFTFLLLEK